MEAPARNGRTRRATGRRGFALFAAGVLVSLTTMALTRAPGIVERLYASGPGPWIARGLSLLTGWVPFSVATLLTLGLAATVLLRAFLGLRRMRSTDEGTPGERATAVLRRGIEWSAGLVGCLLLSFYPLWGLNYARAPLDVRLDMALDEAIDPGELAHLTRTAAARTNEAYRVLHDGSDDIGVPTDGLADAVATSRALESGWLRVATALGMGPVAAGRYGPVKTLGVTRLIDALDIAGIYVPFTGEAHVSGAQPDLSFPAVAAHEQAHQRGLARENEATFAGMLAAIHSDDPLARYSGWARILRALQADLARVDPSAWRAIRPEMVPGVVRDWQDYVDYLQESRSAAAPIVEATNDAYLRAHGVPGGIASYARVTTLLIEWARHHGGSLTLSG